jgi:hypothetical protein
MRRIKHLFTGKFKGLMTTGRREGGEEGRQRRNFSQSNYLSKDGEKGNNTGLQRVGKKQQKRKRKRRDIKETLATRNKYVSE